MTDSSHTPPETEGDSPTSSGVDERWTIPWAALEEDDRPLSPDATLTWHGPDDTVTLGEHTIQHPMLYSAPGRTADVETSCIDTSLPVGAPDLESAPPLPHWANYASLSPTQRANYLSWLADDRSAPLSDINYAFLYFYGLERHVLIDKGDPEEVLRVLMRLLRHYESAPSFFSSASRLAAFLFATKGIEKLKPAWFKRLFMQRNVPLHSDSLAVAATWLFERKKPLPPELAYEIARQDIRCGDAEGKDNFEKRFMAAYTKRFGEGIILTAAKKPQTWKYRPVNPSLQSWEHFAALWSVTSADVMGAYEQFEVLVDLWRTCQRDEAPPSPWRALIDDHVNAQGRVLVPVIKFAQLAGIQAGKRKAFTLAESLAITKAALEAGFELLPDPVLLLRPFKTRERVVLTRAAAGYAESDAYYRAGALLLALGTAIAEVDGEVDHVEVLHVSEIVNSLYHFNDHDKKRLGILRRRLIKFPPRLTSLSRRLRAILTEEERAEAGRFLVGVAAANFTICDAERMALRRAYRAFGIPVATLEELLSHLVTEQEGASLIDHALLAQHMRDTKAFAAKLGGAMQKVVPLTGEAAGKRGIWYGREANPVSATAPETQRKPDPYGDALYALLQRPDWNDADFFALGRQHGIYVDGAVRCLEDWQNEVSTGKDTQRYILSPEENDE